MVGYDSGTIVFFDVMSKTLASAQSLNTPKINCIATHPSRSILCTGHENGTINFFDYSADTIMKTIAGAHSDAVSCI